MTAINDQNDFSHRSYGKYNIINQAKIDPGHLPGNVFFLYFIRKKI